MVDICMNSGLVKARGVGWPDISGRTPKGPSTGMGTVVGPLTGGGTGTAGWDSCSVLRSSMSSPPWTGRCAGTSGLAPTISLGSKALPRCRSMSTFWTLWWPSSAISLRS